MTEAFDESAIRHWLVDYLVTNIGCSPEEIDFDAPLNDLAVGSSDAVVLTGELSELLGRTVSPVEFWQYPTINALAKFLTGGEPEPVVEVAPVAGERGGFDEPIAVVGLGCRFPGGISGPESFWQFLMDGRSAVGQVPADRWDWFDDGSPEGAAALAATTRWGSFLSDLDAFDAEFFDISPTEADRMDPQQRLLLEVSYEALEHAGIPAATLRHSQTGVFTGACVSEYGVLASTELNQVDGWTAMGNALSIISNRVSYFFDFRGPSVTVDTACSSSLVAVHLACQSLRSGESNLALAAGVNLILSPAVTTSFDQLEAMSPTGQCHAFDAGADGFVRGEGCGVVVLKRLSDAVADGDRVLAVVRGSAVNQDGRSNGLMAPNPAAQMAVLRSAYAAAGVEPRDVGFVEAHGTGTLLGDPIEARALGTVLGRGRAVDAPLLIGAVKSNLGHTEAAAGVAGFVKTVLALSRGVIPANLGFSAPNPHIPFDSLRLKVVAQHTDWVSSSGGVRRAGVSSFGFGGTNAHVVLESVPESVVVDSPSPAVCSLVVSGRSAARVGSLAGVLADWLESDASGSVGLADVASALSHRRSLYSVFGSVCARDRVGAVAGLRALAAGSSGPGVVSVSSGAVAPGTVFVFSGQGSQWAGMGRRLLADEPVFAAAVAELEPVFVERVGFSLREVLAEGRVVSGDAQVQPVLMGVQLALVALWRHYGVEPDAVVGHSMGELTAAVVAGALTVDEGLRVIGIRSRLMTELAGSGAVALVELGPEDTEQAIADFAGVEVAGLVSPRQTVVAGPVEQVDAVIAAVTASNRFARRVNMEVASHTALMDPVLPGLLAELGAVACKAPTIPFISTVSDPAAGTPVLDAEYWAANVRTPVHFSRAITAAAADYGTFIEVSPHPILTYAIGDTLASVPHRTLETLHRDTDDTVSFHTNLNATFTAAAPRTAAPPAVPVELPATPWHRTRHWVTASRRVRGAGSGPRPGTLLGEHTAVASAPPGHLWLARLVPEGKPYPGFHRFDGVEVVPLSVLLETLIEAATECGAAEIRDVTLEYPITVDQPRAIQVYADDTTITVSSSLNREAQAQHWVRHVTARIVRSAAEEPTTAAPADETALSDYDTALIAARHRDWGVEGNAFAWAIDSAGTGSGRMHARVSGADAGPVGLLDAAVTLARLVDDTDPRMLIPAAIERVRLPAGSAETSGSIDVRRRAGDDFVVDIAVAAGDETLLDIRGLRYADVDTRGAATAAPAMIAHSLAWLPWQGGDDAAAPGTLAVIGAGPGARVLREHLVGAGYSEADVDVARTVLFVAEPADTETDLDCAVRLTGEVGDLVGRLSDRDPSRPGTLWILTTGVREAVGGSALRQSPLWGLAGVIGAEQPQVWGGLLDLADGEDPAAPAVADAIAAVLRTPAKRILSLRDGEFFASELAPLADEPVREPVQCRPEAAYLITGGMGALGLLTAGWLADRGARRLILAGRTALPARRDWPAAEADAGNPEVAHKITAIRALENRGVTVQTVALDIGSRAAVEAWLAKRDDDGAAPIRGIVHAAGMTEAQLLTDLERDRVERTVWPKVAGSQVLHEIFEPTSLDFFYLTASAGSVFGVPGQGAYAAGNAYLDCLARLRHRAGCNTVSLDWVAWHGLGFGVDADVVVAELERMGSRPIVPAEAFPAWEFVTGYDVAQVVMAPMAGDDDSVAGGDASAPGAAAPVRAWAQMSPEELHTELQGGLRAILAHELRRAEDEVDPDLPFAEMGLNSVMAMAIRREVEKLVGLELSATMLFNHPTLTSFTDYLAKCLVPDSETADVDDDADDTGGGLLDSLFDSLESPGTESKI